MSGRIPKRVMISKIQSNNHLKSGKWGKKGLVLCSGGRSQRAMCNYVLRRTHIPPPPIGVASLGSASFSVNYINSYVVVGFINVQNPYAVGGPISYTPSNLRPVSVAIMQFVPLDEYCYYQVTNDVAATSAIAFKFQFSLQGSSPPAFTKVVLFNARTALSLTLEVSNSEVQLQAHQIILTWPPPPPPPPANQTTVLCLPPSTTNPYWFADDIITMTFS